MYIRPGLWKLTLPMDGLDGNCITNQNQNRATDVQTTEQNCTTINIFISTKDCQGSQATGLGGGKKVLPGSVYGPDISGESVGTQTAGPQDDGAGDEVSLDQRTPL